MHKTTTIRILKTVDTVEEAIDILKKSKLTGKSLEKAINAFLESYPENYRKLTNRTKISKIERISIVIGALQDMLESHLSITWDNVRKALEVANSWSPVCWAIATQLSEKTETPIPSDIEKLCQ